MLSAAPTLVSLALKPAPRMLLHVRLVLPLFMVEAELLQSTVPITDDRWPSL